MLFCAFAVFESAFTVLVVVSEHSVIDELAVTFTYPSKPLILEKIVRVIVRVEAEIC
jgi:hypothetical protein